MGRHQWSNRRLVEDCRCVDISELHDKGYLLSGVTVIIRPDVGIPLRLEVGGTLSNDRIGYIKLIHSADYPGTLDNTSLSCTVQLTSTSCYFGGFRYWFLCPMHKNGQVCGKRVKKLYKPHDKAYFGCRHCHNLTYRCQKEHDKTLDMLLKNPSSLLAASEDEGLSSMRLLKATRKLNYINQNKQYTA